MMQRGLQLTQERKDSQAAIKSGRTNAGIEEMLFHDLTPEDRAYCLVHLSAESMTVYNEPVDLAGLRQPIPRTYIQTSLDHGLPPALQLESIGRIPHVRTCTIATGHTPMFADPASLAALIIGTHRNARR